MFVLPFVFFTSSSTHLTTRHDLFPRLTIRSLYDCTLLLRAPTFVPPDARIALTTMARILCKILSTGQPRQQGLRGGSWCGDELLGDLKLSWPTEVNISWHAVNAFPGVGVDELLSSVGPNYADSPSQTVPDLPSSISISSHEGWVASGNLENGIAPYGYDPRARKDPGVDFRTFPVYLRVF